MAPDHEGGPHDLPLITATGGGGAVGADIASVLPRRPRIQIGRSMWGSALLRDDEVIE
jgi:hypothetical protein